MSSYCILIILIVIVAIILFTQSTYENYTTASPLYRGVPAGASCVPYYSDPYRKITSLQCSLGYDKLTCTCQPGIEGNHVRDCICSRVSYPGYYNYAYPGYRYRPYFRYGGRRYGGRYGGRRYRRR